MNKVPDSIIMILLLPPHFWKATFECPWGLFLGIAWWLAHEHWWTSCWPGIQSILIREPSTVFWPEWGKDRESSKVTTSAWCWSTPEQFCCFCPYVGAPSWFSSLFRAIRVDGLADESGCWSSFRLLPSSLPSFRWFIWMKKTLLFTL